MEGVFDITHKVPFFRREGPTSPEERANWNKSTSHGEKRMREKKLLK